ncbi:DUF2637 domain-containing protein [Kitasatospora purpeofusca]|uniref:DUF2637 domain-containing protein n=1 Tax=Kitasatospora purpeofusca TaxID=67352 RepID=UPI002A59E3F0|nr:DUF2637 domain-containing protein [Kitasatospora purpeofusca]MDY0814295.1 DUF2637 domain-containing protein [Kitasatospora purpeofusca]
MARPSLTKAHRSLLGVVAAGACIISGIGFAGSYSAVKELAEQKGFGAFSYAFPIGVDAGIVVLLALDLVLTWLRIPFPALRQTAWLLTVATIAFNAAASWGDPLGMGMHAVIPLLFVVVVEASRHAVGRIAAITADRHMESVRMLRWLLSPVPTFRLWRRMKLWELRSYDEVVRLEQNRLVYRAQLRFRYGRGWRRSAPIQALLPLKLAKYGVPLDPTVFERMDEDARVARDEKEAREVEAAARAEAALALQEARALQESRAAAALVPAGQSTRAGNGAAAARERDGAEGPVAARQQQPVRAGRSAPAVPRVPGPAQSRPQPQPQQPQQQGQSQEQGQGHPEPEAERQGQPEPAPVEVLAKLAAVRLRDAQEPVGAEQQVPVPQEEELNVWTERAVRTAGHPSDGAPGGRVPGQVSPWFKPPRPTDADQPQAPEQQAAVPHTGPEAEYAEPLFVAERFAEQGQVEQGYADENYAEQGYADQGYVEQGFAEAVAEAPEFAEHGQRPIGPAPRPGSYRLDPEQAFEALVSYIDTFEHEPDPQRLAAWLTKKYGVAGNRPDGSVHPKDVEALYPELRNRYATSGRD